MIVALMLAGAAAGSPPALQTSNSVSGLSAIDLFGLADDALRKGDQPAAEAIYRALANDPLQAIRNEARFRLSRLREQAGDRIAAATLLRAILDEEPNSARVRLELARLLFVMDDQRSALRELRAAQTSGGLPPDLATAVNQFVGARRSQKPWGFSLEVALAPDSNINRATTAGTLDTVIAPLQLDRNAQAQSGMGLKLGGQAYARIPFAAHVGLLSRASTQANLYRDHQFNDIAASTQIGIEWLPGKLRFSPAIGRSWRWYSGHLYAVTDTLSLNARQPVGKRSQIDVDLAAGRADYSQNTLQSGMIYDGSLSLERAFSARSGGAITLSGQRQTSTDPGYATASAGVSLLAWREIGRATAYATATLRKLESDARLFLYVDRRRETYWRLGGGMTWRAIQFAGFSPLVRVSAERNTSSITIYDYRRFSVELGIGQAF